nr:PREDICTED: zinc finger MYM-type protein 1-like [Latimeria chalumnae]|eukprot:XP_014341624.1 PREDICTED: zinc finger MYM-type protein 1-like [Latimeria chalumnae]
MTICIRWVDKFFKVHGDCIGLVQLDATDAQYLTTTVNDIWVHCMLPLSACRGRVYDGAGNMAGKLHGLAARIQELELAALYVHCFAHCLNLCLQDSTRQCITIRNALDICMDIEKLVRYSAKRMTTFEQFQKQFASEEVSIKPLCPTRWIVRTGAINAVLVNCHALVECCQEINSSCNDEYGRIAGDVLAQLKQFKVYFGLRLAHLIFSATERTSRVLQRNDCSLQEGLQSVELTGAFLAWQRTDEAFHLFYKSVVAEGTKFTGKPSLLRAKRLPKCLDSGTDAHRFETPEAFFRQQYFEAFDITAGELKWHFEQSMLGCSKGNRKLTDFIRQRRRKPAAGQ